MLTCFFSHVACVVVKVSHGLFWLWNIFASDADMAGGLGTLHHLRQVQYMYV